MRAGCGNHVDEKFNIQKNIKILFVRPATTVFILYDSRKF